MRRWWVTLIGLVMMGASIYGYGRYAEYVRVEAEMTEAVMPAKLIVSGETVDHSMLRRVLIPVEAVDDDALRSEAEIVGKTTVVPIGPNEQIAAWKLADRKLTPREGERYVSFPTDDVTNVGNMLRRGDRVDVWVEFEEPKRLGERWAGAVKVIEGLEVASVRTKEGAEVSGQNGLTRSGAGGPPGINTFIMDDALYEAYALASLIGTVKLALPDLSLPSQGPAGVTAEFEAMRERLAEEGVE